MSTFLKFKALVFLSKIAKPISQRRSRRFLRSAAKCTPYGGSINVDENLEYHKLISEWGKLRRRQAHLKSKMLNEIGGECKISIVIELLNEKSAFLDETMHSILHQSYRNIEIIFSCDSYLNYDVCDFAEKYLRTDDRIVINRDTPLADMSKAISSSSGEFIFVINEGDILDEDAILEMVFATCKNHNSKIIYIDEDIILGDNTRNSPHFKPDWNRELLYGTNYIGRAVLYCARIIKSIEVTSRSLGDCRRYDALLKCIECVDDESIIHIPKVLYSRREFCVNYHDSDEIILSARRKCTDALEEHLLRVHGFEISVSDGLTPNTWKVEWPTRYDELVSIIIPTRNRLELIETAVTSIIEKTEYSNFEILIIDNNSDDPDFLKWASEINKYDSRIRVIRDDRPFNYSAINNSAVKASRGDIIALLNNDIEILDGNWLSEMVSLVQRDEIGCVGAKLLYADGRIQHAGVIIGFGGVAGHGHVLCNSDEPGYFGRLLVRQEYTAVTAACLLVRRKVYEDAGGLNENNLSVAFNDVDFCMKVKSLGYKNIWTPYATLTHYESVSRGQEDTAEKKKRFASEVAYMVNKWEISNYEDPSYNVNMTLRGKSFTYTDPVWKHMDNI